MKFYPSVLLVVLSLSGGQGFAQENQIVGGGDEVLNCRQQVLTTGGTDENVSAGLKQCVGKLFFKYGETKFMCDLGKKAIADEIDFDCANRKFESQEEYMVMGESRNEKVAFLIEAERIVNAMNSCSLLERAENSSEAFGNVQRKCLSLISNSSFQLKVIERAERFLLSF